MPSPALSPLRATVLDGNGGGVGGPLDDSIWAALGIDPTELRIDPEQCIPPSREALSLGATPALLPDGGAMPAAPDNSNVPTGGAIVPAAPCPEMGSGPFAGLQLKISNHTVHKESAAELIVTNLKWFNVEVACFNHLDVPVENNGTLVLRASLIFESGMPVQKLLAQDEPPLKGQTECQLIRGRAVFKMQVGKKITSDLRNKQRFRVLIEPADEAVRRDCPALTLRTEPFKVMVKIDRPVKTSQPVPLAPAAHTNRELMQLQHQQEEIDMLKQSNADIKKELAELKKIAKRRRGD